MEKPWILYYNAAVLAVVTGRLVLLALRDRCFLRNGREMVQMSQPRFTYLIHMNNAVTIYEFIN